MNNTNQSEDEGLREQLREYIGIVKFGPKYWDYITTPPTIPRGKYPSERAIEELDNITNHLMALISQKIIEARLSESNQMHNYALDPVIDRQNLRRITSVRVKELEKKLATLTQGINHE